jgi:hypothetical protein
MSPRGTTIDENVPEFLNARSCDDQPESPRALLDDHEKDIKRPIRKLSKATDIMSFTKNIECDMFKTDEGNFPRLSAAAHKGG